MTNKKHGTKNFDNVINFLSQDSSKVITVLKENKNFINKLFEQYLDELPIIKTRLQYIDELPSLQGIPEWTNDFLSFVKNIRR